MRKLLSTLLTASVLLTLQGTSLNAQQEQPVYNIHFYTLGWDNYIEDLYFTRGGRDINPFISNAYPSGPYHYNGVSPLSFYSIATDSETGAVTKKVEAQVNITASSARPTLFVFLRNQNSASGMTYNILQLPNAVGFDANGNSNEVFFLNITGKPLAIDLNGKREVLAANQQTRIATTAQASNHNTLQVAQQGAEGWETGISTMWLQSTRHQDLIFIIRNPESENEIQLRRFGLRLKQE